MKNLISTILLLIIPIFCRVNVAWSQKLFSNPAIGINLPPLIGNTLDVRLDTKPKESLVFQTGLGVMINNTLLGSFAKDDDFTDNHKNSGAFAGVGLRHLYLQGRWSHLYFGYRLIGGYYEQHADYNGDLTILKDSATGRLIYTRENKKISASGPFLAAGIELFGAEFIIKKRIIIDIGFQVTKVLFRFNELSDRSVYPGTGALGFQGTISPKIILGKKDKTSYKE